MTTPAIEPQRATDLVERIRSGDPGALSAAYFQFAGQLVRLAERLLGSRAEAEDAVQDLFVALPEALEQYQEQGRFAGWLNRALVRLVLMRLRGQRRRRETDLETDATHLTVAGHPVEQLDLERALRLLPDDDRTIVVLKAIEGYSYEEIAALCGLRENTCAVRYHRALNRLRSELEGK